MVWSYFQDHRQLASAASLKTNGSCSPSPSSCHLLFGLFGHRVLREGGSLGKGSSTSCSSCVLTLDLGALAGRCLRQASGSTCGPFPLGRRRRVWWGGSNSGSPGAVAMLLVLLPAGAPTSTAGPGPDSLRILEFMPGDGDGSTCH